MVKLPERLKAKLDIFSGGTSSIYRIDTREGKLRLRRYSPSMGFMRADFKPVNHKRIVREFIKAHPENKGLLYLHVRGRGMYHLLDSKLHQAGRMDFISKSPDIKISESLRRRKLGTLLARLAIDHHEHKTGEFVDFWSATNLKSYKIALKLGFVDGYKRKATEVSESSPPKNERVVWFIGKKKWSGRA
jgi:hypothetical protein